MIKYIFDRLYFKTLRQKERNRETCMKKKDDYYHRMCNFDKFTLDDFDKVRPLWLGCFTHGMRYLNPKHKKGAIRELFYDLHDQNWDLVIPQNTPYKDYTSEDFYKKFCEEAFYISDRLSYWRLIRTHWCFCNAFENELGWFRSVYRYHGN